MGGHVSCRQTVKQSSKQSISFSKEKTPHAIQLYNTKYITHTIHNTRTLEMKKTTNYATSTLILYHQKHRTTYNSYNYILGDISVKICNGCVLGCLAYNT